MGGIGFDSSWKSKLHAVDVRGHVKTDNGSIAEPRAMAA
jgi:hypothetical protein